MSNHVLAQCEGVEKTEKAPFFILSRAFIVYAQSILKKICDCLLKQIRIQRQKSDFIFLPHVY